MIAEVALNVPLRQTFDYRVPPGEVERVRAGTRAIVPFGRRTLTGIVVALKPASQLPEHRLKALQRLPESEALFPADLLAFTRWVADYYFCGWGEVLNAALPCGLAARYRIRYRLRPGEEPERALDGLSAGLRRMVAAHPVWSEAQWARAAANEAERNWLGAQAGPGGVIEVFYDFAHAGRARLEKWLRLRPGAEGGSAPPSSSRGRGKETRKAQALRAIAAEGELPASLLAALMPQPSATIRALAAEGLIEIFEREAGHPAQPPPSGPAPREPFHALTADQRPVVEALASALDAGRFRAFLLEGVTGSGKTEVYLHAVREALARGRAALLLVPEIALTAEILNRFRSRFGEQVAILHSAMEEGTRFREWMRARKGQARVVIGARSALFAPLPELGLVIVDEEHDPSYKQDETPRYHARDAALVRARERGALVILGTATPSMESLRNVALGKLDRLHLPHRVENRALPEVELVDLRHAARQAGSALFSLALAEALRETLRRRQQAILFLNRRGFAQLMRCEECGEAILCPNCSLSLVYHRALQRLRCHHCEYAAEVPAACPACGAEALRDFGLGTERIEQEVAKLFPLARVLRMDSDALRRRGELERMLAGIRDRRFDVIIGTQILTKGHDFPSITLVAAVLADVALNLPDFRAAERTFQILTQMAGRAGRGEEPGKVVIQTYNPRHHALITVRDHHTARFADTELALREASRTPPFTHLALLWMSSTAPDRAERLAREVARRARAALAPGVVLDGPAEAPIRKVNRRYRWMAMLRSVSVRRLHQVLARTVNDGTLKISHPDRLMVDVDPQNLL
jgi:primosomal protein N' (replication factor Y)